MRVRYKWCVLAAVGIGLATITTVLFLRAAQPVDSLWNRAVPLEPGLPEPGAFETALAESAGKPPPNPQRVHTDPLLIMERNMAEHEARSFAAWSHHLPAPPQPALTPTSGFSTTCGISMSGKFGCLLTAYKEPLSPWQRWLANLPVSPLRTARLTRESVWVVSIPAPGKSVQAVYIGCLRHSEPDNIVMPELVGLAFTPDEKGLTFHWHKHLYAVAIPAR